MTNFELRMEKTSETCRLIRYSEFLHINHRPIVIIGFWRWTLLALKSDAGIADTGQGIQSDGYDADDERAEKGEAKAVHLEMRREQRADEVKQQGVDDEREEAERKNQQRQRKKHQNRPDERIKNAQQ